MNKNIQKVNPYLWLVNFDHIRAGYIKELEDIDVPNNAATITIEGILLIHWVEDEAEHTQNQAKWWHFLMGLKDKQLQENEAFKVHLSNKYSNLKPHRWNDELFKMYVKAGNYQYILEFLNHVSTIELQRRQIVKNYKRKKLNPLNWIGRR